MAEERLFTVVMAKTAAGPNFGPYLFDKTYQVPESVALRLADKKAWDDKETIHKQESGHEPTLKCAPVPYIPAAAVSSNTAAMAEDIESLKALTQQLLAASTAKDKQIADLLEASKSDKKGK